MPQENTLDQAFMTIAEIQERIREMQKTVTTTQTSFPVRENLAAEAKIVVAIDTPLLNWMPTHPGAGKAAAWREITSFGSDPSTVFFAEGGAPSSHTTVYNSRSETYVQVGLDSGVTRLAVMAGANFQDQLAIEKRNAILHLKRLEENALINANGPTSVDATAPNSLEYNGLLAQIATANGSYVAQNVGTTPSAISSDITTMLKSAWDKGAYMDKLVVRSSEALLISQAVTLNTQSALRVDVNTQVGLAGGFHANKFISPIDGSAADVIPDKFHTYDAIIGLVSQMPAPVPGQGGDALYFDVLMDYAMLDIPTANDQFLFRILRYLTFPMPGRKYFGLITNY